LKLQSGGEGRWNRLAQGAFDLSGISTTPVASFVRDPVSLSALAMECPLPS
jgi:hypothetical protein